MQQLTLKRPSVCALVTVILGAAASAQELPRGEIVENVECQQDASQSYALYLPSYFDRSRRWPVILMFDAGGRGRAGVERYRAAAERYGYVVTGSNNSRNGPWSVGMAAAAAMAADVQQRFPIDPKRLYTAGMSGGARVAIMVAQSSSDIAGVFASSAGYSNTFHKSERFPIFGSAGTEDFNYREMRTVDTLMTSPHRVEVFEGGHTWLPSDVATRGVEWMEIQAMKSGLRSRDQTLVAELFSKRMARAAAQPSALAQMRELKQIAADFEGLSGVANVIESAAALQRRPDVARDLRTEQAEEAREQRVQNEVDTLTRQLRWPERAVPALVSLKSFVASLLDIARQQVDSSDRRIARRVLSGLRASRRGVPNAAYQEWIGNIELPAPPRRE
jgi:dienelactone hydrolase